MSKSYYEILDLTSDATTLQINAAYKRAKNTYADDAAAMYGLATPEECKQILEQVEEAYSILGVPDKRKQYDEARGINGANLANTTETATTEVQAQVIKNVPREIDKYKLDYKVNKKIEDEISKATVYNGAFLKKVREYKNVSIERMSDLTKLSKTYINSIENEHFERKPADVFLRGFVYQYAKSLRLDPEAAAQSYLEYLKSKN